MMTSEDLKRANWVRVKHARSVEAYSGGHREMIGLFPDVRYQLVEVMHDSVLLRDGSCLFWLNISELEEPRGVQRERRIKQQAAPRPIRRRRAVAGSSWFFRQMQQHA